MLKSWTLVCAAVLAAYAAGGCRAAASQEPRLQLALSGEETSPGLSVQGGAGSTYAIGRATLNLKLHLAATPQQAADPYRLVASSVFIKSEGPDQAKTLQSIAVGALAADLSEETELAIDPLGPVAQNAKAACAAPDGAAARRRDVPMLVPVVWRVTTGAFAFSRLAAQGLNPEEAMLTDAAYYGDTASEDVETAIAVKVLCEDAAVAVAAPPRPAEQKSKPAKLQQVSLPTQDKRKAVAIEPVTETPKATPIRESVATASPFRCDGGIVRETTAGPGYEVCLCPGNTARREIGDRSFTCEKRLARSR